MYGQGRPQPAYGGGYQPPHNPAYGAPPHNPAYGAPPHNPAYGAPPQNPAYGAPPPRAAVQGQYGGAPYTSAPAPGYNGGAPAYGGAQPPPQYGQPYGAPPPVQLPPGVSPELWQWFQSVDVDRNGEITAHELKRALMNGNWTPFNDETCRLMIGMFDKDRSGTINAAEFGALWKYIQEWKACFDRFDTDRSGNIDANELSTAFATFGYRLSPAFSQLCIRVFDRRFARSINFDDFIQCCVMLKTLTNKFREKDVNQTGNINVHYEQFLEMVLDNTIV